MKMKDYFNEKIPLIGNAIREVYPREVTKEWMKDNIGWNPENLYSYDLESDMFKELFSKPFYELFCRKSKMFRPVLTCLTHDALEGENSEIYKLATIPQIIHEGSLVIDDFQDNSDLRRGEPSLHKIYGPGLAVNSSTFNFFLPLLVVGKSQLFDSQRIEFYDVYAEEMSRIFLGQGMDLKWSQEKKYDVNPGDCVHMLDLKTSTLLSMAAKIGSIAAGADMRTTERVGELSSCMGVAFQIQDDIFNLEPPPGWSKSFGEDITEGKLTFPVAVSMNYAGEKDREKLVEILRSGTSDKKEINEAIDIMRKYGALDEARKFARRKVDLGLGIIDEVFEPSEYSEIYKEFLDYAVNRKS